MPFCIWSNANLPDPARAELTHGITPHKLVSSPEQLAEADIAFGQPDPSRVITLSKLRWVHITSAGYTPYDRDDVRRALKQRGAMLTNSSSVYDEPCAEHVLGQMLMMARQFPGALANQAGAHAWVGSALRARCQLLAGQTALILGFGAIARRLVELLAPLKMNLAAVRQSPRGDEPIKVFPVRELDRLLPSADHVINILPASTSTMRLVTGSHFAAMKRGAIFYNIGRGVTVDQDALLDLLRTGHLGAAMLDVTDPEPLPPAHPLWTMPNCIITPHTGGGHANEFQRLALHFLENLRLFERNEPLKDRVF